MARRLTKAEWRAIDVALAASLASPVLDGHEDEENELRRAMRVAQAKVWERLDG